MLTELTPPLHTALSIYSTVKAALRLQFEDELPLTTFLDAASAAIVTYCQRPFARAVYEEVLPGYGGSAYGSAAHLWHS